MKKQSTLYIFLLLGWATLSFSQPGAPDPEFGAGEGKVITTLFNGQHSVAYGIAVQPDGKIVVAGGSNAPGGNGSGFVLRYLPDGSFDPSFNGNGIIILTGPNGNCYGRDVKVQPDGKIIVLARITEPGRDSLAVYRFLDDGNPDHSFDVDGIATFDLGTRYQDCKTLALQQDGKILVGGYAGNENEMFDKFFVARLNPNGKLDPTFHGDGFVLTSVGESWTNIAKLLVQPDHKIVAVGYAVFDGEDHVALARYNSNGTLDLTFQGTGIVTASVSPTEDRGTDAVLQPDGKIVVSAYANSPATGKSEFAALRFSPDGTLDPTFSGDGMLTIYQGDNYNAAYAVALQPDGKIILGGSVHSGLSAGSNMGLVRLLPNGSPDLTFEGDGTAEFEASPSSESIYNMSVQSDGKIAVAGYVRIGSYNSIVVARFISGLTVSTDESVSTIKNLSLYPNPIVDEGVLEYNLEEELDIAIQLVDAQGRVVKALAPYEQKGQGPHHEKLAIPSGISPGTYYLNMLSAKGTNAIPVVVQ